MSQLYHHAFSNTLVLMLVYCFDVLLWIKGEGPFEGHDMHLIGFELLVGAHDYRFNLELIDEVDPHSMLG